MGTALASASLPTAPYVPGMAFCVTTMGGERQRAAAMTRGNVSSSRSWCGSMHPCRTRCASKVWMCAGKQADDELLAKNAPESSAEKRRSVQDKLLLRLGKDVQSTREEFSAKVKADEEKERRMQRGKKISAVVSVCLGIAIHYLTTKSQLAPAVILGELEKKNLPIEVALSNGRPTVVEFYTDWCTDCKVMAPKLNKLHAAFSPTVNFLVVNGEKAENQALVSQFHVDGIPHISFIYEGKRLPDTTFIGMVPADVMQQQIDALRARAPLPYQGLDLFSSEFEDAYGAE